MNQPMERKQRVVMSRRDCMQCAKWISDNLDSLKANKMTNRQLARKLAEMFKCPVMSDQVLRNLLMDMDVKPTDILSGKRSSPSGSHRGRFTRVLATQLAITQRILINVCQELGSQSEDVKRLLPTWLAAYAGGKTSVDSILESGDKK